MTQAANNSGAMPAAAPMHVPAHEAFARFPNFAEWWHSTGDVPLERIANDSPPGTAIEQELLRLVEGDRLVELVDGTLVEKPVGSIESLIAVSLAVALVNFVRPRKLGLVFGPDATLRMKSGRVRLPDVTFVSRDDLPGGALPKTSIVALSPTLAVDVVSEGNTAREMRQKAKEYFESGSKLVWMIYPKTRTVDVFEQLQDEPARTLSENDVLDGGAVLPGLQISVADLFVTAL